MVATEDSQTCQQFSARKLPGSCHMALEQLEHNYPMPFFLPSTPNSNPAQFASDMRGFNLGQHNSVGEFPKLVTQYIPCPTGTKGSQCALSHGLGIADKLASVSCSSQKRFLIFDQSDNHTRLFFSPSFSSQNHVISSKNPLFGNGTSEKAPGRVDQQFLMKPVIEEKWDENHFTDEEGEMPEDSEEIDALLYSDSDDDESDDDNDEVTSTGHTPLDMENGKSAEEFKEEVEISDEPPKRQRLLDGRYKKSSLVGSESPVNRPDSCNYEDDVEYSSCGGDRNPYHDDIGTSKWEKKVKIREALKILEIIVPGLNSNDPLSVIDNAISYLKLMKTEAEALETGHPECESIE